MPSPPELTDPVPHLPAGGVFDILGRAECGGTSTLLLLLLVRLVRLDSSRLAQQCRNRWLSDVFLTVITVVLLVLDVNELVKAVSGG